MKCVVLVAGYATRLLPLTQQTPKALLKVRGKCIIDWVLDDVNSLNIFDEIILVSNHKFIKDFYEWKNTKSYSITIIDDGTTSNETRLGAVKDIQYAVKQCHISTDTFVMAGDNILDFSLSSFIEYFLRHQTSCVMRYYELSNENLKKRGVATVDLTDLIVDFIEKPKEPNSEWCCAPFYFFKKQDISMIDDAIASGSNVDAPGGFIEWLFRRAPIYAMEMPGKRYDISDIENYELANRSFTGLLC